MATRQYIGARYVPKFYVNGSGTSEWTANTAYEALTIVTRNGNSYTSKIPVPASVGAPENNAAYWVSTGIYNQQVEAYRREVIGYRDDVANLETEVSDMTSVEIVGCVLRKTSDGWEMLNDTGHRPKHISSVAVDQNGNISIIFDKIYSRVGSFTITPDESYGRGGLGAGASVAVGSATLQLYHTRNYGGMFDIAADGTISYLGDQYNGDIQSVSYSEETGQISVVFKPYVGGGYFNSLIVQFGKDGSGKLPVPITNFSNDLQVNITPSEGLTGSTRVFVNVSKGGYNINANDFPIITNGNFWINGFMWV